MKNKLKKILFLVVLIIMLVLPIYSRVFADGSTGKLEAIEYSEAYKAWLELSEEEKEEIIMPSMYVIEDTSTEITNPLKLSSIEEISTIARFSLGDEDVIPTAVPIKSQGYTGACWAFASIAALETSIALRDYHYGFVARAYEEYDFSERHLEYATTREFIEGENANTSGYARILRKGKYF